MRLAPGFQSAQSFDIRTPEGGSNVVVRLDLPVEKMRGSRVQCDAMVRATGVSPPPKPWNGVKFMLVLAGPDPTIYAQQDNLAATFDWQRISFTTRVPALGSGGAAASASAGGGLSTRLQRSHLPRRVQPAIGKNLRAV